MTAFGAFLVCSFPTILSVAYLYYRQTDQPLERAKRNASRKASGSVGRRFAKTYLEWCGHSHAAEGGNDEFGPFGKAMVITVGCILAIAGVYAFLTDSPDDFRGRGETTFIWLGLWLLMWAGKMNWSDRV